MAKNQRGTPLASGKALPLESGTAKTLEAAREWLPDYCKKSEETLDPISPKEEIL